MNQEAANQLQQIKNEYNKIQKMKDDLERKNAELKNEYVLIEAKKKEKEEIQTWVKAQQDFIATQQAKLQTAWTEFSTASQDLEKRSQKLGEYKDFMNIALNAMRPSIKEDDLKKLELIEEGIKNG